MDMLVALWNRCQTTHDGRTGLSLPRFRVFMMEDFACTPDMLPLATRVFNLFDDDASGELDWRELVAGLSKVRRAWGCCALVACAAACAVLTVLF